MSEEKEIKIRLRDNIPLNAVFERIEKLGFKKAEEKIQVDSYFDYENFYLSENAQALRIRTENGAEKCFEFKALFYLECKKYPWFVEEICIDFLIKDQQKLKEVFGLLGIESTSSNQPETPKELVELLAESKIMKMFDIKKHRTSFQKEGTTIEVDQVDGLGNFLEIESDLEPHELLHEFGFGELGSEVRFGYVSAFREKFYGIDYSSQKEKFEKQPDWNVLESEREFYKKLCEKNK
ncbi:MAG: class IV adenylate cyclase [Candidatus Diapherotrites archaeon]|nr:class IV adenylate cyclase [Candidatus Diapherotrites archaeon]